jgi:hypothetical protein
MFLQLNSGDGYTWRGYSKNTELLIIKARVLWLVNYISVVINK